MNDIFVDLIANGQAQGQVTTMILNKGRMDKGRMRPFIRRDGSENMTI